MARPRRLQSDNDARRFLLDNSEVDSVTGCWLWTGCKTEFGYGRMRFHGVQQKAHRVAYALFAGDMRPNLLVCHHCDRPACINPKHLFLGTHKDNTQDAVKKGRMKFKPGVPQPEVAERNRKRWSEWKKRREEEFCGVNESNQNGNERSGR
jgi:hypothetical protein